MVTGGWGIHGMVDCGVLLHLKLYDTVCILTILQSVVEVPIPQCKSTPLQVKVLHSISYLSKSTEKLSAKCKIVEILIPATDTLLNITALGC